ncbi:MAG TPA: DinB family protein [Ramlibacter sp.]|nr:DinB family protein [Ramlibacter sp.]
MADLPLLLLYTAWANRLLYGTLAAAPASVIDVARPGRRAGVRGTLGHIWLIAEVWKGHLTGEPHGFQARQLEEAPALAELQRRQATVDDWYVAHASQLDAERLAQPVDFTFIGGGEGRMLRSQILLHVVNHATYHRGYVADMLYESGLKPPTMDLPVYLREAGTG